MKDRCSWAGRAVFVLVLGLLMPARGEALSLVVGAPSMVTAGGQVTFVVALDEMTLLNGYELFVSWDPTQLAADPSQIVFNPSLGEEVLLGNRFPDSDIFVTPTPVFDVPGACNAVAVGLGLCDAPEIGTIPADFMNPSATRLAKLSTLVGATLDLFAIRFDVLSLGDGGTSFMVSPGSGGFSPALDLANPDGYAISIDQSGNVYGGPVGVPEPTVLALFAAALAAHSLERRRSAA